MFSRRHVAESSSPEAAPHTPPPTHARDTPTSRPKSRIRNFFRRIFRRRTNPTIVSATPEHQAASPFTPLPAPAIENSRAVPESEPAEMPAPSANPSESEVPAAPNVTPNLQRRASRPISVEPPPQPNSDDLLAILRDRLIEALALALLEQQEVESAEAELKHLRKISEIVQFEAAVDALEDEYVNEIRRHPKESLHLVDELFEMENRLILARLLLSIETLGMGLMVARQRFGQNSLESFEIALILDNLVQLLSGGASSHPSMLLLMAQERVTAVHRVHTPGSDCPDILPARLSAIFEQLHQRRVPRSDTTAELLLYRVRCQELRVACLRNRGSGKFDIAVRRNHVLEDSRELIMRSSVEDLRKRLYVKYEGEEGNDFGGVSREWLTTLSHAAVLEAVQEGWLVSASNDGGCLQVASLQSASQRCVAHFEFLGRLAGLALFHSRIVDLNFVIPIFKFTLGKHLVLGDLADIDVTYHRSLVQLLELSDIDDLMLMFCVDFQEKGVTKTFDLITNGSSIPVTNVNKGRYVDLVVRWLLGSSISAQLGGFKRGLEFVVPASFIRDFTAKELAQLTCGLSRIDLDDWRSNTIFENGYSQDSPQVEWFFEVLASIPPEKQSLVLKFATGASRPPPQGFVSLPSANGSNRFCLYRNEGVQSLPVGHTCINRLDLPAYASKEVLAAKLMTAIEETEGFGIV